jgi:hypothetical protein
MNRLKAGTALGTTPGSPENPQGTAKEPLSGTAPVPVSKPLGAVPGTTPAGRRILEAVMGRIRQVSPPGLGTWSPAWELVHEPGDRFLDAFNAWQAQDTPATRHALEMAAGAFVAAWREAAHRWEAQGRPSRDREEVAA